MTRIPVVYTMEAPTRAEGFSCTLSSGTGSFSRFTRRGRKNGLRRKQIIVTNRGDNAIRLTVDQAADSPSGNDLDFAVLVYPSTNVTLYTDSDVQISNAAAVSCNISVCEIFYPEP